MPKLRLRTPVPVLPEGETLIAIDGGPAFPAALAPMPKRFRQGEIDKGVPAEDLDGPQLWLRRSVAHWLGVYIEAATAEHDDIIRFEWSHGNLTITATDACYSKTTRTLENVPADDEDRYMIRTLSWREHDRREQAAALHKHSIPLKILCGNANPSLDPVMLDYLGADLYQSTPFCDTLDSIITDRGAGTPFDDPRTIYGRRTSSDVASQWRFGWQGPDGSQPEAILLTQFVRGCGYLSVLGLIWTARYGRTETSQARTTVIRRIDPHYCRTTLTQIHDEALADLRLRYHANDRAVADFFDPASEHFTH